jgi:hypothetical protein
VKLGGFKLDEKPREEKTSSKRWGQVWALKDQRRIAFEAIISGVHRRGPMPQIMLHGGHVRQFHDDTEARMCSMGVSSGPP